MAWRTYAESQHIADVSDPALPYPNVLPGPRNVSQEVCTLTQGRLIEGVVTTADLYKQFATCAL